VCLKERRRVVLLLRETPLRAGHIELMAQATRNGAIIMPPVPAFYTQPETLDDIVNQTVARALELLDITLQGIKRWDGNGVVPGQP
jgi:flavin prenyltransferase